MKVGENMTKEQEAQVINALVDFVIRVSKGDITNEKETETLPAVTTLLLASNSPIGF